MRLLGQGSASSIASRKLPNAGAGKRRNGEVGRELQKLQLM